MQPYHWLPHGSEPQRRFFSPGLLSCCPDCPPPPPPWMPGPCPLQQPSSPHLSQRRSSHCSLLWPPRSVMSATTAAWQGGPTGPAASELADSAAAASEPSQSCRSQWGRSGGKVLCRAAPHHRLSPPYLASRPLPLLPLSMPCTQVPGHLLDCPPLVSFYCISHSGSGGNGNSKR